MGRGDHLVSGPDPEGPHSELERGEAGVEPDGVLCPAIGGELGLEGFDIRAQNEVGVGHHASYRAVNILPDPRVLGFQVDQGYRLRCRRALSPATRKGARNSA
jgi:hypothetical protein